MLWLEDWLDALSGHAAADHARPRFPGRRRAGHRATSTHRKLKAYTGNYSAFERERAAQLALQQATYEKQQRADRASAGVRRPLPREGDEGEAGAEPAEGARADGAHRRRARRQPVRVRLRAGRERRAPAGAARRTRTAAATADAPPIFAGLDFALLAGARIGLLGANGAGKSTLVKALGGHAAAGGRRAPRRAEPRHRLLRAAPARAAATPTRPRRCATCSASTRRRASRTCATSWAASTSAARWRRAPVERFSGGEKARLALAMIVRRQAQPAAARRAHQPPRHRDARGAGRGAAGRTTARWSWSRTTATCSRATTDALLAGADGSVEPFDGDLDDYRDWVLAAAPRPRFAGRRPEGRRRAGPARAEARGSAGPAAPLRGAQAASRAAGEDRGGARRADRGEGGAGCLAGHAGGLRGGREGPTQGVDRRGRASSAGRSPGWRASGWRSPRRWRRWTLRPDPTCAAGAAGPGA